MFSKIARSFPSNLKWHMFKKPLQKYIISPHKRKKWLYISQKVLDSKVSDVRLNEVYSQERYASHSLEKPLNVVFFGTDEFSLESLKALVKQQEKGVIGELLVVTVFQKGHLHAVAKFCKENAVQHEPWPISPIIKGFEIGIVVSFGYLLPKTIIDCFPLGILNVHGSLLPRWRGAAPIIHSVLNEDDYTGITVMKIHPHRFDVGEVVHTERLKISSGMKSGELTRVMAILGASCLTYCLQNLPKLLKTAQSQPSIGITKAPKIKETDSQIVWEHMTADLVTKMFQAYDDFIPLWTTWQDIPVKLKEMVLESNNNSTSFNVPVERKLGYNDAMECPDANLDIYQYIKKIRLLRKTQKDLIEENLCNKNNTTAKLFGRILYSKNSKVLRILCLDGFVEFRKVLLKGRKAMNAADFYNGFVSKVPNNKRYFY